MPLHHGMHPRINKRHQLIASGMSTMSRKAVNNHGHTNTPLSHWR
jgi:hypothetical protein